MFKFSVTMSRSCDKKYDFYQIKLETSVIPLVRVILSGKSICGIILVILSGPVG